MSGHNWLSKATEILSLRSMRSKKNGSDTRANKKKAEPTDPAFGELDEPRYIIF